MERAKSRYGLNGKFDYKNWFNQFNNAMQQIYGKIEINKQVVDSIRNSILQLSYNYPLYTSQMISNNTIQNINKQNDDAENTKQKEGPRHGNIGLGDPNRTPSNENGGKV